VPKCNLCQRKWGGKITQNRGRNVGRLHQGRQQGWVEGKKHLYTLIYAGVTENIEKQEKAGAFPVKTRKNRKKEER